MPTAVENPPVLSPEFEKIAQISGRWFVAQTLSRQEKVLARLLLGAGVGYFLPMVEMVSIIAGRKCPQMRLVMPGYLFFAGDDAAYDVVTRSRCTAQIIHVIEQRRLVRELESLQIALNAGGVLLRRRRAAVGSKCRVDGGSFQGLEGIVVGYHKKKPLVILQVTAIGTSVGLEIPADLISVL